MAMKSVGLTQGDLTGSGRIRTLQMQITGNLEG
jgi:hypothetical protein